MKRQTFGNRIHRAWRALRGQPVGAPRERKPKALTEARQPELPFSVPPPWIKVSESTLARASLKQRKQAMTTPFVMPDHPPGVVPKDHSMAMDEQVLQVNAWANQALYNGSFFEGTTFLGYTYLSELAQRPEYRRISEVLATEATRKWIKLVSTGAANDEKLKELKAKCESLDVKGAFRKMVELDGFFGRGHLYLDTGSTEDKDELVTPIGDGLNDITKAKFGSEKGFLKRLQPIEPVWCYPAFYNANNPMRPDWYKPQQWFVQGKQVHASRLLTFVGREVPDLLKPAYSFGGLSLSQMAKPYVDNWLRARQSVSDLIWSFSTSVLHTDLSAQMQADGQALFNRLDLFTLLRNNRGIFALQKGIDGEKEEFDTISTPLGTLDALQAQAQEHMCSVTGTPVVKLLGIQPAGLNASSDGELETWYDWVEAFQEKFIREKLTRVLRFVQLSLWGAVDPEITFTFESLRSDDPVASATERKVLAETDQVMIDAGVISNAEARARVAADPESGYAGIDVDDVPDVPDEDDDGQFNLSLPGPNEAEAEPADQPELGKAA